MAKLYFSYSAMNAGKSTLLLQASYNYQERGMETLLLISAIENRTRQGEITSRIGLNQSADIFTNEDDIYEFIRTRTEGKKIACIFIDEAQWMSGEQIWQLAKVVDELGIPVMCYGLRTD
ncbi:MAG: thymidine kinase, partial [Rhizobiaceae bacterium]|nr:thymidine kinase [Rhizobiaceae bacterium]